MKQLLILASEKIRFDVRRLREVMSWLCVLCWSQPINNQCFSWTGFSDSYLEPSL